MNESQPVEQRILSSIERDVIRAQVVEALQSCFDPEIPVNIYELGLVYDVIVGENGSVDIRMTLTSPHCPAAQSLPPDVERRAKSVHGVTAAKVSVVWDPPWTPALMSEAAKLELGMT
jgi:FeS assembly SUF system protein